MRQLVNKNLITLNCVLFCFLAGIGCIFPFLPLHMVSESVGLDRGEARLISTVAPCIALLGPALLGPLIDKLSVGRGSTGGSNGPSGSGRLLRVVTAICLILSALFYTLLLAVPYTERHEARRPQVLFMCDSDGAQVMQEVCIEGNATLRCDRFSEPKSGVLAVARCEYGCADDNMTWLLEPFPTTTTESPMWASVANDTSIAAPLEIFEANDDGEASSEPAPWADPPPPHLCYGGVCQVYMPHQGRMRVSLSLLATEHGNDTAAGQEWCVYKTGRPSHCEVPKSVRKKLLEWNDECRPAVRCEVLDPYDEPQTVLADAECRLTIGDPATTFWTYFIVRILADIWPTAALALLGAACVIATRETSLGRGDVGRLLAFGTIGLAIFPPLAGLAAQEMPDNPFLVPFIMHAVFMFIGALILLLDKNMPLSAPEWWWHTATGLLTMPMSAIRRYGAETAAVFFVVALLGLLWSGIDAYLPWTVSDISDVKNSTFVELGLTMTAGALPAVPVLFWAEAVVDFVGHSNVFIIAFTFYCLRYTGLAFTTDYTWVVVCELLEVFTLSLVWVTAMLYFRHLVPRKYTATGQALPVIAHFCLGRCIGAIVSGLVSDATWPALASLRDVYRALAVLALLAAAAYLALYHLLLAPRCAAPAQPPPQNLLQGLNANGGSNGTYSPMRVYHEERSRKGHFRY